MRDLQIFAAVSDFTRHALEMVPLRVYEGVVELHLNAAAEFPDGGRLPEERVLRCSFRSPEDLAGELQYGDPLPDGWPRQLHTSVCVNTQVYRDGRGYHVQACAQESTDLTPGRRVEVRPRISPPRLLNLDATSALLASTLASGTPRLEWLAPTVGSPDAYLVTVLRVAAEYPVRGNMFVARYFTPERAFTLPPGLLEPGNLYTFTVAALAFDEPEPPGVTVFPRRVRSVAEAATSVHYYP